jgi:hypothetical protein
MRFFLGLTVPFFRQTQKKTTLAAGKKGKYRQETTDLMYSQ